MSEPENQEPQDNLSEAASLLRGLVVENESSKDDERALALALVNMLGTTFRRIENIDNALTRMATALENLNSTIEMK